MVTIYPTGGLCNYLRVVFSYHEYAKSISSTLTVIWIKTDACPGYFLDYFEPIPTIQFITNHNTIHNTAHNRNNIMYKGCSVHQQFQPNYTELKIKPYLQNIIQQKINVLNTHYISVHIRRTDHIALAKKNNRYTNDEAFVEFIEKAGMHKLIYIATDNKATYDAFKKKYADRIKLEYHQTNQNSLRETSLQDAIIDIYMCVHSDTFMGSGWSSFSDFIHQLRMNQNES